MKVLRFQEVKHSSPVIISTATPPTPLTMPYYQDPLNSLDYSCFAQTYLIRNSCNTTYLSTVVYIWITPQKFASGPDSRCPHQTTGGTQKLLDFELVTVLNLLVFFYI